MRTTNMRLASSFAAALLGMVFLLGDTSIAQSEEPAPSPFGGHVHALAVNPETDEIFLGARPIYRSSDGGKTWTKVEGIPKSENRANITAIVIDPKDPRTMYATGHGISVIKSIDGGATWTTKAKGLGGASTEALAMEARNSSRLYVWVLGDGLYRSDDAAESWQRMDDGPKQQEIRSLVSVNASTGMGGIWLYAGLDIGIVKSPDCFCGWDRLPNAGLPGKRRAYSLAVDPRNPSTLYAGMRDGVFKTTDGGKTWRQTTSEVSDAVVTVHSARPSVVYAASDNGTLFRSDNAGETWQRVN